jgi:Flp pilus assembly protein TadG
MRRVSMAVRPWRMVAAIRSKSERGAAMVEFALILPLLMVLVAGLVEIGDALNTYLSVVGASRDVARIGSKGSYSDTTLKNLALTDVARLRDATSLSDITITHLTVDGNNAVKVKVCNRHTLLMNYPLLPLPNPMNICATTTMRQYLIPSS